MIQFSSFYLHVVYVLNMERFYYFKSKWAERAPSAALALAVSGSLLAAFIVIHMNPEIKDNTYAVL